MLWFTEFENIVVMLLFCFLLYIFIKKKKKKLSCCELWLQGNQMLVFFGTKAYLFFWVLTTIEILIVIMQKKVLSLLSTENQVRLS